MGFFSQYLLDLLSLDGRNGFYFCKKMRVHFAFGNGTKSFPQTVFTGFLYFDISSEYINVFGNSLLGPLQGYAAK